MAKHRKVSVRRTTKVTAKRKAVSSSRPRRKKR